MRRYTLSGIVMSLLLVCTVTSYAEKAAEKTRIPEIPAESPFADLAERSDSSINYQNNNSDASAMTQTIWPFKKDENGTVKPKSTRKAFFLSMLLPGLGETYVGSKRGLIFMGVEVLSWYMYLTNSRKGYDLEDEFREYADTYWHYNDTVDSNGNELDYNYWGWLNRQYELTDQDIGPEDYDAINEYMTETNHPADMSYHHYSGQGNQQDYEMIGKYPQFVYGWEDVAALGVDSYDIAIQDIDSSFRDEYETMRDNSNKKLKAGQRGIHFMLINRVLSAIDAGRLAYHHNKSLESELSMVKVRVTQKRFGNEDVPMIILTKKF